jgi:N-methylhydantoinase A
VDHKRHVIIVGIDAGGTFTDFIAITNNGEILLEKVASTPKNPEKAVIEGLTILNAEYDEIIHGTTIGTNAMIQRKGAKCALITTEGFRDVLEIGRQNRRDIYEIVASRPDPLVSRDLRYELPERVDKNGMVTKPLNSSDIDILIEKIKNKELESVAVSFLFSYLYTEHELMVKEKLEKLSIPVSISSEVFPEYREYERTNTTVVDAYLKPILNGYIKELHKKLIFGENKPNLAIMKSSKGLATPEAIIEKPVETLISGLAGGVLAAELTSELTGYKNIISLDIGGTSTDVAQITEGKGMFVHEITIDRLPVNIPAVDIVTIGAGGGSIASVKGGLLRVGPESAGAEPGPASYDLGGKNVTVTDADLVYGILGVNLAGGKLKLNVSKANDSINNLAQQLNISSNETIRGVRRIFHENITSALRSVSTEKGKDPRKFALAAFGGAGPVHAVELAELMDITTVIIPPYPGIWSAFGLLAGDYRYDISLGKVQLLTNVQTKDIDELFEDLLKNAINQANNDGVTKLIPEKPIVNKKIALRYKGQSFEIPIEYSSNLNNLQKNFHNKHKELYGFASDDEPLQLVALKLSIIYQHKTPQLPNIEKKNNNHQIKEERKIIGIGEVPVYLKNEMDIEKIYQGPIIIDQEDTTTWIPNNWNCKLNNKGFMIVTKVSNGGDLND